MANELLFEPDFGEDNSPQDDTEITTTILYYGQDELATFKRLCKLAMIRMHGHEMAKERGNISDAVLAALRNYVEPELI